MKYVKLLIEFVLRYISPKGRVEKYEFIASSILFILIMYQIMQGMNSLSPEETAMAGIGGIIVILLFFFQIKKRIADLPQKKKHNPFNWFMGKSEEGTNENGDCPKTFWIKFIR